MGARSGLPLEDLGVEANVPYDMTLDDVLGNNEKLIAFCAKLLSKKDRQVLTLKAATSGLIGALSVSTEKLDRVDILVNGRVVVSVDVADGATEAKLPKQVPPAQIAASGYRKDKLVVRARLTD